MIGLNKNLVTVYPYDPTWADEYAKEEKILKQLLKDFDVRIEHVGSTSIPGLSAKPIIDIAIGSKTEEILFQVAKCLEDAGYDMLNAYEDRGEILARKGAPECRTHYIHIQLLGSEYWNEFVYFKKYLLDHPESVKEYQKLKEELSVKYADERKKYTAAKNEFITNILEKAYKMYHLD